MQEKSSAIVNAVKLDAKTPIPVETNGKGYGIRTGRKYVPFFDNGDNFFQVMLEACLLSPTNMSCINSKTKFAIGQGLHVMKDKVDADFDKWRKRVNKKGQTLNDILKMVFNNDCNAGNSFIEIVKVKVGTSLFVKLFVKNYIDCRLAAPENDDDIPTHVIVSTNFRKKGVWSMGDDKQYVKIPLYTGEPNQEWLKDGDTERAIIHFKNEVSGYDYYGMPSNVSSLPQQILEYKFSRFNLDNFDNNLTIGGLIVLQANMSGDEAKKTAREITKAHTGDGERGKYVVLSSEHGIENSKIIPFDQHKEYDFIEGSKRIESQILLANEWSKALIDPEAGGLGNSGKQIRELYETKMNTVIAPLQARVIEKVLIPILTVCDEVMKTKFTQLEFGFKNLPVLGITNDVDANAVLTVNEARALLGYAPLTGDEGNRLVKQTNNLKISTDV